MIRFAEKKDIPEILEIYAPYVLTTTNSFEYRVPTQEEFTLRFEKITSQFPWLVWEEDGRVLGYAYGSLPFSRTAYQWSCEVSIYLSPEVQGKGIGRKLYAALEHLLFLQGYRVIYSVVTSENTHSLDFHTHVGYRKVAELPGIGMKFGRWLGTVWLEKRLECDDIPQAAPVACSAIVENNQNLSDILDALTLFQ